MPSDVLVPRPDKQLCKTFTEGSTLVSWCWGTGDRVAEPEEGKRCKKSDQSATVSAPVTLKLQIQITSSSSASKALLPGTKQGTGTGTALPRERQGPASPVSLAFPYKLLKEQIPAHVAGAVPETPSQAFSPRQLRSWATEAARAAGTQAGGQSILLHPTSHDEPVQRASPKHEHFFLPRCDF